MTTVTQDEESSMFSRVFAGVALLSGIASVALPSTGHAQVTPWGVSGSNAMVGEERTITEDMPRSQPSPRRPVISSPGQAAMPADAAAQAANPTSLGEDTSGLRAEPDRPPSDFQLFAATSVGAILPVFGQDLFKVSPSTFAPIDNLPPAPGYVVGAGDELVVRAWGQLDADLRAVVSREGMITIPRVGVVSVNGTRFEDLGPAIKKAIGRYYKNFELSVSLGRLRSVQVFVVGQANRPGLYTVSSLSTLMNALFASGGPSSTGSMRGIQLRRSGTLVGEFDLYDVLLRGDKSKDLCLQSGDVIFIPPVGPVAAIAGRVKNPGIYELKRGVTSLADLLEYAGGLATTASTQSVLLERLDQLRGRIVHDLAWDGASLSIPLRDGDVVTLRAVSLRFENAVTLRGHVAFPIRTAWKPGLTVADLIPDRSVLIPESYWERSAARVHEASTRIVDAHERLGSAREGAHESGDATVTQLESLMDEVNWDYAVVERLDRTMLEPQLIPFDLAKAIAREPVQNIALEPGDTVTLFSKRDIRAPAAKRTYFVRIEGEVARPGVYQVKPAETLHEAIERAGGFTANAYLFGAEFTRESARREQERRLAEIASRSEEQLERAAAQKMSRALSSEDVAAGNKQLDVQRQAIARLRNLRPTGRLVLQAPEDATKLKQFPDIVLEDGDRFYVPMRYATVSVNGSVFNQSTLMYRKGKTVGDYLRQAGGAMRGADTGSTFVLRADGTVISRRQVGFFGRFDEIIVMPNDAIVVPENYSPVSWVKELKDWSQIFYQFGLGVAAINVLK
jgi:polysaccharide biosynthesis/export protein